MTEGGRCPGSCSRPCHRLRPFVPVVGGPGRSSGRKESRGGSRPQSALRALSPPSWAGSSEAPASALDPALPRHRRPLALCCPGAPAASWLLPGSLPQPPGLPGCFCPLEASSLKEKGSWSGASLGRCSARPPRAWPLSLRSEGRRCRRERMCTLQDALEQNRQPAQEGCSVTLKIVVLLKALVCAQRLD